LAAQQHPGRERQIDKEVLKILVAQEGLGDQLARFPGDLLADSPAKASSGQSNEPFPVCP
jgi:hypothetical protein